MICCELVVHKDSINSIRDYASHVHVSLIIVYELDKYIVFEMSGKLKSIEKLIKYNRLL